MKRTSLTSRIVPRGSCSILGGPEQGFEFFDHRLDGGCVRAVLDGLVSSLTQ